MSDLETMLAPLVESAPDPAPLSTVVARAAGIRRRRRVRTAVFAVVVVGAVSAGVVAVIPGDGQRVRTVATPPVTSAPRPITVGPVQTFPLVGMAMISAYGSLWLSQADRVARLNPVTGAVTATIGVPGSSDYRDLATGAGSVWIADTGTGVVSRIDPTTDRVTATISMRGSPYVPQGIAFFGGELWIARPEPVDTTKGVVSVIDPATNQIVRTTAIRRTFYVRAGAGALWYVDDTDLVRLDTKTLRATVVRRDAMAIVTIGDNTIWLQTERGVVEVDARTGAAIGRVIPSGPVNAIGTVADGVLWLGSQPDSSSAGTVTPYDIATGRAIGPPTSVGLPILTVVVTPGAVWVAVYTRDGVSRIPFSR